MHSGVLTKIWALELTPLDRGSARGKISKDSSIVVLDTILFPITLIIYSRGFRLMHALAVLKPKMVKPGEIGSWGVQLDCNLKISSNVSAIF